MLVESVRPSFKPHIFSIKFKIVKKTNFSIKKKKLFDKSLIACMHHTQNMQNTCCTPSHYPTEALPSLGFGQHIPHNTCFSARPLSQDEKALLQCAYVWVHTYDANTPPSLTPSYTELWYMLQYLQQLQIFVHCISTQFTQPVDDHSRRYDEAAGQREYSFSDVLYYDFTQLKALLRNCAAVYAGCN